MIVDTVYNIVLQPARTPLPSAVEEAGLVSSNGERRESEELKRFEALNPDTCRRLDGRSDGGDPFQSERPSGNPCPRTFLSNHQRINPQPAGSKCPTVNHYRIQFHHTEKNSYM
jgi:hypothetical protein